MLSEVDFTVPKKSAMTTEDAEAKPPSYGDLFETGAESSLVRIRKNLLEYLKTWSPTALVILVFVVLPIAALVCLIHYSSVKAPLKMGDDCSTTSQCGYDVFSGTQMECLKNKKCGCDPKIWGMDQKVGCLPKAGHPCTNGECYSDSSCFHSEEGITVGGFPRAKLYKMDTLFG